LLATAAAQLGIERHAVNAVRGERVRGPWHIQNVNAYTAASRGGCRASRAWRPPTCPIASAGFEPWTVTPSLVPNPSRFWLWPSVHVGILN